LKTVYFKDPTKENIEAAAKIGFGSREYELVEL